MEAAGQLDPYLDWLRELPFIRAVRLLESMRDLERRQTDALISVTTPEGKKVIPVEVKRSHLTRELAERLVQLRKELPELMVFAPLVGRELAERFRRAKVGFVDLAGNCHVEIGDRYYAHIEGRRGEVHPVTSRAVRAATYQVFFVLLAKEELLGESARTVAAAANVSPQTVLDTKSRLFDLRMLVSRRSPTWAPGGWKAALDFFVSGFASTLAPSLFLGRYRARDRSITEQDAAVAASLGEPKSWRWGGGAACERLTRFYRGESTVIYLDDTARPNRLQLLPDTNGRVLLASRPCAVAFESPDPLTVHPLLVYTDLLAEGNDRATEAAGEVFDRYLRTRA